MSNPRGMTEEEWQSLLSSHEGSDNFVVDVITDLLNLANESTQMEQDQYGDE